MPRLSLWKEGARTNDYKFFDGRIREQFTVGGTTINIHKYLGAPTGGTSNDATQPAYDTFNESNIQDLLFMENRDRKYDTSVYALRGIYNVSDIDFDLSQFGLFLQNDTLFIGFHLNDMVEALGRKLMAGDVLELPHLRDYYPLDIATGSLKRYYVIQDAARASEGYSPTWFAHIWRVKCVPLVDGREYKDILDQDSGNGDGSTIGDLLSTYNQDIAINDAVIEQALREVPMAGYDTSNLYTLPVKEDGSPKIYEVATADSAMVFADSELWLANAESISPTKSSYEGYLVGDGNAPNGFPVLSGIAFPGDSVEGDFYLRTDYFPNRMFRFDGKKWRKVHDFVRTPQLPHYAQNQKSGFVNNTKTTELSDGQTLVERQNLSELLRPKAD